jgi:hypothetical protein
MLVIKQKKQVQKKSGQTFDSIVLTGATHRTEHKKK